MGPFIHLLRHYQPNMALIVIMKKKTVSGHFAPPARPTLFGALIVAAFVTLPFAIIVIGFEILI